MTTSEIQRRLEEIAKNDLQWGLRQCGDEMERQLMLDFLRYLTTLEDSEVKEKAKMILEGVS